MPAEEILVRVLPSRDGASPMRFPMPLIHPRIRDPPIPLEAPTPVHAQACRYSPLPGTSSRLWHVGQHRRSRSACNRVHEPHPDVAQVKDDNSLQSFKFGSASSSSSTNSSVVNDFPFCSIRHPFCRKGNECKTKTKITATVLSRNRWALPTPLRLVREDWRGRGYTCVESYHDTQTAEETKGAWRPQQVLSNVLVSVAMGELEAKIGPDTYVLKPGDELFVPAFAHCALEPRLGCHWRYGFGLYCESPKNGVVRSVVTTGLCPPIREPAYGALRTIAAPVA